MPVENIATVDLQPSSRSSINLSEGLVTLRDLGMSSDLMISLSVRQVTFSISTFSTKDIIGHPSAPFYVRTLRETSLHRVAVVIFSWLRLQRLEDFIRFCSSTV